MSNLEDKDAPRAILAFLPPSSPVSPSKPKRAKPASRKTASKPSKPGKPTHEPVKPSLSFATHAPRAALEKKLADQLAALADLDGPFLDAIDMESAVESALKMTPRTERDERVKLKAELKRVSELRFKAQSRIMGMEYRVKMTRKAIEEMG